MKRINSFFKLALFAFVISVSAISCSNDEFFGFDDFENEEILDIHHKYIACSTELEEYVIAMYELSNKIPYEASNNKEKLTDIELIPENQSLNEAYNQLITIYPEFTSLNYIEKMEIINYCDMHSKKTSKFHKKRTFIRTKGGSPEYSTAWKSLNIPPAQYITKVDENTYTKDGVIMYIYDSPEYVHLLAYRMAFMINGSDTTKLETGGLIFDDSAIYYIDPNAAEDSIHLISWPYHNYKPKYVFHYHTDTDPISRTLDSFDLISCQTFKLHGCPKFRIYNLLNDYEEW
jgi:hypothetical protein